MGVRLDRARDHVLGVELKNLGGLVVGPDHGVKERHEVVLWW
jgi:hypothetical protein